MPSALFLQTSLPICFGLKAQIVAVALWFSGQILMFWSTVFECQIIVVLFVPEDLDALLQTAFPLIIGGAVERNQKQAKLENKSQEEWIWTWNKKVQEKTQ